MTRALAFHGRFADMIPSWQPFFGDPRLLAAKLEYVTLGGSQRLYVDLLLGSSDLLHVLLFAQVEKDFVFLPEAYRPHAQTFTGLVSAIEPWLDAHTNDTVPGLTLFDSSAELAAIAGDEKSAVVPGLAAYQRMFNACDMYRAVAGLAAGRDVLVIGKASGYGAHLLRPLATSIRLTDGGDDEIDRRLNFVQRGDIGSAELVVAFDVQPANVLTAHARARDLAGSDGIVAIAVRGEGSVEALSALGLIGAPLVRVAGDALPPLLDAFAIEYGARTPSRPIESTPSAPIQVSSRPLHILFALRPSAAQTFGGDVVQIQRTAAALRARGHDAQVTTSRCVEPSGYDIVHFSNLTTPFETLAQMDGLAGFGGAVVMMPIFTDHADETVWALSVQNALFAIPNDVEVLAGMLNAFANRQLTVTIPFYGRNVSAGERLEMAPGYLDAQREITRRSDLFIANAHAEMHRVYRYLDSTVPYEIAPSAADPSIYSPQAAERFRSQFRLGDYVLLTGRFEPRKNQALLMYALRQTGRRIVMIGCNYDAAYSATVRSYLGPNTVILRHMPESDLAGALAAARVVVLPSYDEVVSLTSLNAAACGASLVLTRQSYEHEYLRSDAEYCDPVDYRSIAGAVDRAWSTHDERLARRMALSRRIRAEYTWERAAQACEAAYYRLLDSNPRGRQRVANAALSARPAALV